MDFDSSERECGVYVFNCFLFFIYKVNILLQDALKVLLKHKVNVNKAVSASKNKVTPLMMAAQRGDLEVARLLVQSGATVELLGQ
jgi:ankyrin repeat protein